MEPKPSEEIDGDPVLSGITHMVKVLLVLHQRRQKDLVDVLGVNATGITRRMKLGSWTISDLDAMARYFEVPISTFFEDPNTMFDQGNRSSTWITDSAGETVVTDDTLIAI